MGNSRSGGKFCRDNRHGKQIMRQCWFLFDIQRWVLKMVNQSETNKLGSWEKCDQRSSTSSWKLYSVRTAEGMHNMHQSKESKLKFIVSCVGSGKEQWLEYESQSILTKRPKLYNFKFAQINHPKNSNLVLIRLVIHLFILSIQWPSRQRIKHPQNIPWKTNKWWPTAVF